MNPITASDEKCACGRPSLLGVGEPPEPTCSAHFDARLAECVRLGINQDTWKEKYRAKRQPQR